MYGLPVEAGSHLSFLFTIVPRTCSPILKVSATNISLLGHGSQLLVPVSFCQSQVPVIKGIWFSHLWWGLSTWPSRPFIGSNFWGYENVLLPKNLFLTMEIWQIDQILLESYQIGIWNGHDSTPPYPLLNSMPDHDHFSRNVSVCLPYFDPCTLVQESATFNVKEPFGPVSYWPKPN